MVKQDGYKGLGFNPAMSLREVAEQLQFEEGAEKPLTIQRILAIEKSALAKLSKNPTLKKMFDTYVTGNSSDEYFGEGQGAGGNIRPDKTMM
jgi:hypothetical protein